MYPSQLDFSFLLGLPVRMVVTHLISKDFNFLLYESLFILIPTLLSSSVIFPMHSIFPWNLAFFRHIAFIYIPFQANMY